jgi:DNA-binding transcriptional regulator YiaG
VPNIAAVLKAEICRLAKKEAKTAAAQLKKASVQYRSDIAKLRRLLGQQAKAIANLKKHVQNGPTQAQTPAAEEPLNGVRFSARSAKAQRKRLGLSAEKYAKLVGVSALTIYSWESGRNKPRKAQLAALVAVRGIGKREALKRLEEAAGTKGRKAK